MVLPEVRMKMLWPVFSFTPRNGQGTIAVFFTYDDAVDYVNSSERNLYIGKPRYERSAQIVQLEARKRPDGRWECAA